MRDADGGWDFIFYSYAVILCIAVILVIVFDYNVDWVAFKKE